MLFSEELLSLIKNQNNDKAKTLIVNGNLHNAVDSQKNTLLHYAAEYQNPEIVQFLLDLGSEYCALNDLEETPLVRCLKSDSPCKQVVEILFRAGTDYLGRALMIIDSEEWLNERSSLEKCEILKFFMEQIDDDGDWTDFTVLLKGNREVINLLLQTNIDLNRPDFRGWTLIHGLTTNFNPDVVELLHGKDYNVNVRDDFGETPLMSAAQYGNPSTVEFLLSEGADIEATNSDKKTALYLAITEGIGCTGMEENVQVLLEHGANVQVIAEDESQTIFDHLLTDNSEISFKVAELPLAYLALQEKLGTSITDLIRGKINSHHRYKSFFEDCQRQLSAKIYPQVTLFDLLTCDRQLERCLRNEKWASELIDFQTKMDYYNKILGKRIPKAARMVELRKAAGKFLCKLYKMDYESYPFIADEIVSYLEEKDLNCLLQVEL